MRDLHSNIKAIQHLAIAAYTASQDPAAISRKGFDSLEFLIDIGAITNIANSPKPSWSFKLQESDSQNSGFTDVTDSNLELYGSAKSPLGAPNSSTGIFLVVDSSSEDGTVYRVGYRGNKEWVKVVPAAANTPGSTPLSITALLGHPALRPTAD